VNTTLEQSTRRFATNKTNNRNYTVL